MRFCERRARQPLPAKTAVHLAVTSILSGVTALSMQPVFAADNDAIAEVVVTARKQVENLQDVPESIDVFSKKDLENLNISQFEDYVAHSPSVSFVSIGPGYQQFFMRGVSDGSSPNVPNTSTTGMYLDETSLSYFGGIPDLHLYDIERIEVLNGPQGTLYGAGSMSGAIRIVTSKPDPSGFSAGVDLDGGLIDGGQANGIGEGFINIPLIEGKTALRISGFYDKQGGFINNLLTTRNWLNGTVSDNSAWAGKNYNHEEMSGARIALLHRFNDDWKVTLSGDYQHQQTHGAWDQDPARYGERNVSRFGPESGDRINRLMSLTVEGDVGIGNLIYAGSYWSRDNHTVNEYSEYVQYANITPSPAGYSSYAAWVQGFACDYASAPPDYFSGCNVPTMYTDYRDHTTRWSHEVRLSSKPGGSTHWTVGVYFEQTRDLYSDLWDYPGIKFGGSQATAYTDYYHGTPLPEEWYSYKVRGDNHQVAGFGEITQDLSKQWSVIFGFRQFKSRDAYSNDWAGYFWTPKAPTPTETVSFSKHTFKAGVNFKATDNTLFYFSFAQGFRDGGFNTGSTGNPNVPPSYQPDTLNSYELGWKTMLWDGKFLWNGAGYYMPWKNYQTAVFDLAISPNTFNANIGNARVYGVESNIEVHPVHGLTFSASASYTDSRLTSNNYENDNFVVTPGQRLSFVPYFSASASLRYEHELGARIMGYGEWDVTYKGDEWSDLNQSTLSATSRILQPGYSLQNLRFGVNNLMQGLSLEAYVTNICNVRAVTYTNRYNYDGRETTNEPRVYGLRLKYRFGGKTGGE